MERTQLLYAFSKIEKEIYDIVENKTKGYCLDRITIDYNTETIKDGYYQHKDKRQITVLEIHIFTKGNKTVLFRFNDNGILSENATFDEKSFEVKSKYFESYTFDVIAPSAESREDTLSRLKKHHDYLLSNAYWTINEHIPLTVNVLSCEIKNDDCFSQGDFFDYKVIVKYETNESINRIKMNIYRIGRPSSYYKTGDSIHLFHCYDNLYKITVPPKEVLMPKIVSPYLKYESY